MTAIEIARQAESYGDPVLFVENALERAKTWLSEALEHGDIDGIVELKSQAEAIRAYTTQKQLGHDAELTAAEIVRRAERGLGLAIRKGQEMGTIAKRGQGGGVPPGARHRVDSGISLPSDYASHSELTGNDAGIYHLADDADDERFEEALNEARAERNLSRANVVRKIRNETRKPTGGRSEWHYNKRHLDPNRIVRTTVEMLDGIRLGLDAIRTGGHLTPDAVAALNQDDLLTWISSLGEAINSLNRLKRDLAMTVQGADTEGVNLQ